MFLDLIQKQIAFCLHSASRIFFVCLFFLTFSLNFLCLSNISSLPFLSFLWTEIWRSQILRAFLDSERWHQVLYLQALCYLKCKETCSGTVHVKQRGMRHLKIYCQTLKSWKFLSKETVVLEVTKCMFSLGISSIGATHVCSSGCIV